MALKKIKLKTSGTKHPKPWRIFALKEIRAKRADIFVPSI